MTELEARRIIKLLARAHNIEVDAELFEIWFQSALSSTSYETGLRAAKQLNETSAWMPKPAQFNEQVRLVERRNDPSHEVFALPSEPGEAQVTSPQEAKQHIAALAARFKT